MLDVIVKEIAATVKESVQAGIKALSKKFERRFKAVEDRFTAIEGRFDALPIPKDGQDGKSITADDVRPVIVDEVEKAAQTIKVPEVDYDVVKSFVVREVAAIPKPQDGKSVTVEEVEPLLKELVAGIELPVPEKGEKGDSITLDDVRPLVDGAVKDAVQNIQVPQVDYDQVKNFVTAEVAKLPTAKDGEDGKSLTPEDIAPLLEQLVGAIEIPVPKDGEPGKSITLDDVRPVIDEAVSKAVLEIRVPKIDYETVKGFITEEVAKIPTPKDGESVTPEDVKPMLDELVKTAVAEIPPPKDGETGKDADPIDMDVVDSMIANAVAEKSTEIQSQLLNDTKPIIAETVKTTFAEMPRPKDGKDADPIDMDALQKMIDEKVESLVAAKVEKAVANIHVPEPRNGEDGKDALEIEILPEIDHEKSYTRGVFAIHKGGLWRSYERTSGMRGWEPVVDGIADIQIDYDGERGIKIITEKSSGDIVAKEFVIPLVLDRGVYKEGQAYAKNDGVTYAGSYWIAQKDAPVGKPGDSNADFRLAVKKGRDAHSQVKVK